MWMRARRRIKTVLAGETLLRTFLLLLSFSWLGVGVVLPLAEVVHRSLHADVVVSIWGEDDIRLGGRRIQVEGNRVLADGEPLPGTDTQANGEGVVWEKEGDGISLSCSLIKTDNDWVQVSPVQVRTEGNSWWVDGTLLDEESYQLTVTRWIGFRRFAEYFTRKGLSRPAYHSLWVSSLTALISCSLAFVYAYGLTRTRLPGKAVFQAVALLPIFAPTMLYGLSLVYLFGNKGLVTTGFFQFDRLIDIHLYGPVGIVIAESVFAFPPAVILLQVALRHTDARLYDAARSLGASPVRTFFTVTLPGARAGLLSAAFVCFTLSFTDFGAPKVVGGNYAVLAVDIYKQVIGQQNFGMGSTVSIVMLLPTLFAFAGDWTIRRRQSASVSARFVPLAPKRNRRMDLLFFCVCSAISFCILVLLFAAGFASLVKIWPYDFRLGLSHYSFDGVGGGGYGAYWNSLRMSLWTAVVGTLVTFMSAYLVEKSRGLAWLRRATYFLSILPLALPGLVIGIGYVFFFNRPSSPFHFLYGTMAILVVSNVVHFYTVSLLTHTTALRQLDKEFETISESLAVPFPVTLFRVTVPMCLPAILEVAMFYFVSSMATVSAVIFLASPETRLASVAVVHMDDAGDTAPAAAMCMLIVLTNVAVRLLFEAATFLLKKRTQAWTRR